MSERLQGKTVIVTGAASGLGKAIALRFANEGAWVVAADLQVQPLEGGDAMEFGTIVHGLLAEESGTCRPLISSSHEGADVV